MESGFLKTMAGQTQNRIQPELGNSTRSQSTSMRKRPGDLISIFATAALHPLQNQQPSVDARGSKPLIQNKVRHLYGRFTNPRLPLVLGAKLEKIVESPGFHRRKGQASTKPPPATSPICWSNPTLESRPAVRAVCQQHHLLPLLEPRRLFKLLELASHNYHTYTHSVNVCAYAISLAETGDQLSARSAVTRVAPCCTISATPRAPPDLEQAPP